MKKLLAIFFTVFLNLAFYSCTPAAMQDDTQETPQACCGGDGEILPPPPSIGG